MKKLLLVFAIILSAKCSFSQIVQPNYWPNLQPAGTSTTMNRWAGVIYPVYGIIMGTYSDTTSANYLSYIRNSAGLYIRIGDSLWLRNSTATRWINTMRTSTATGSVTSVGLTMPSAFNVSGSPVTGAGTFSITGAGTTSQYIRGDGTLATFPTIPSTPTLQQVLVAGNTLSGIPFSVDGDYVNGMYMQGFREVQFIGGGPTTSYSQILQTGNNTAGAPNTSGSEVIYRIDSTYWRSFRAGGRSSAIVLHPDSIILRPGGATLKIDSVTKGIGTTALRWDHVNKTVTWADTTAPGAAQNLQSVLTTGSILSSSHTVTGSSTNLYWLGFSNLNFQSLGSSRLASSSGGHTSSINTFPDSLVITGYNGDVRLPGLNVAPGNYAVRWSSVEGKLTLADTTTGGGGTPLTLYSGNGSLPSNRRVNANGFLVTFDSAMIRFNDTRSSNTSKSYGGIFDFNKNGLDLIAFDSTINIGLKVNTQTGVSLSANDFNNLDTNYKFDINGDGVRLRGIPTAKKAQQLFIDGNGYIFKGDSTGNSGSITSFIFTDGNGFDGTVTNSTTTPTLSLTTTLTQGYIMYPGSGGAISGNSNLFYDAAADELRMNGVSDVGAYGLQMIKPIAIATTGATDALRISNASNLYAEAGIYVGGTKRMAFGSAGSSGSGIFTNVNYFNNIGFDLLFAVSAGNVEGARLTTGGTFSVGASQQFAVNSSGNITKLNNVTTSFPSSNSAGVLTNNGSGTLTWVAPTTPTVYVDSVFINASADSLIVKRNGSRYASLLPTGGVGAGYDTSVVGSPLYVLPGVTKDTIAIRQSSDTDSGYLSKEDWQLFYNNVYREDGQLLSNRTIDANFNSFHIEGASTIGFIASGPAFLISNQGSADYENTVSAHTGQVTISSLYNPGGLYNAIEVFVDSMRLYPHKGQLNIDTLRTWTNVADTLYKKPMTWDTRNGRWEYASNWFGGGGGGSYTGTTNQVIVTGSVLSTPQNIHTGANIQFATMGLGTAAGTRYGLTNSSVLSPGVGETSSVYWSSGTINEAASGTHGLLTGMLIGPPTIASGSATVTNTATLYVNGAPSATVSGANHALFVAGSSALSVVEGNLTLTNPGTGGTSVLTAGGVQPIYNKRWTPRTGSTTSSATPTINTDLYDVYKLTAQTANITSFTTNLTGTPNDGEILEIQITGTATRTISWGSSFVASTIALPTTTNGTATLTVVFQYYTTSSYGNNKWVCANSY